MWVMRLQSSSLSLSYVVWALPYPSDHTFWHKYSQTSRQNKHHTWLVAPAISFFLLLKRYEPHFAWQFLGPVKRTPQLLTGLHCLSIIFNDLQMYSFFEIFSWKDHSEYSKEVEKKPWRIVSIITHLATKLVSLNHQPVPSRSRGKRWLRCQLGDKGRLSVKAGAVTISLPTFGWLSHNNSKPKGSKAGF